MRPDLAAAMRLLDAAKAAGFSFARVAPGPDGPLLGVREGIDYRDEIYLGGFGERCHASRRRKSCLIVPAGLAVTESVEGDALTGRVPGSHRPRFHLATYTHLVPSSFERARLAIDGVFGLKSADGLETA